MREKVNDLQIHHSSSFLQIHQSTNPKLAVFYLFDKLEYQVS